MAIAAGAFANWFMLYAVFSLWFDTTGNNTSSPHLYAAVWALGLMGVFAGVALTPIGENFFRWIHGCGRPTRTEEGQLKPLFDDVCEAAGVDPGGYDLLLSDDKFPNAFAMGRRTVCVTRALLLNSDEDVLRGILAHELGHHVHGDAVRSIIFYMITLVGQIIMWGGIIVTKVLGLFRALFAAGGSKHDQDAAFMVTAFSAAISAMMWFFQIFVWIPIYVGAFFGMRQQEYKADKYAVELGFAPGLLGFLEGILDLDGHPSGFMGLLYRTHPKTRDRIRALEDLLDIEAEPREDSRVEYYPAADDTTTAPADYSEDIGAGEPLRRSPAPAFSLIRPIKANNPLPSMKSIQEHGKKARKGLRGRLG